MTGGFSSSYARSTVWPATLTQNSRTNLYLRDSAEQHLGANEAKQIRFPVCMDLMWGLLFSPIHLSLCIYQAALITAAVEALISERTRPATCSCIPAILGSFWGLDSKTSFSSSRQIPPGFLPGMACTWQVNLRVGRRLHVFPP